MSAHNEFCRSTMLRRMGEVPSLAHLVPYPHLTGAAPTDLLVGGERLFPDGGGDSQEGRLQGLPLTATGFCVTIQPELRALDHELAPWGGCARGIQDDVYAMAPAWVVFPAVARFVKAVKAHTELEGQWGNCLPRS